MAGPGVAGNVMQVAPLQPHVPSFLDRTADARSRAEARDTGNAGAFVVSAPARASVLSTPKGRRSKTQRLIARLKSLAMPPAYINVRYAADSLLHLQAVGEDAAGRLQYRYHPNWLQVREGLKARKLENIAKTLPLITRAVRRFLRAETPDARQAATAAVVYLVSKTALRAGSDSYGAGTGNARSHDPAEIEHSDRRHGRAAPFPRQGRQDGGARSAGSCACQDMPGPAVPAWPAPVPVSRDR